MSIVQNVLGRIQKESEKPNSFSLFFCIVSLDRNAFDLMMLKNCNSITEEGSILVLQKLSHSIYNLIIVSKIATTHLVFEFKKQEEVRWNYA